MDFKTFISYVVYLVCMLIIYAVFCISIFKLYGGDFDELKESFKEKKNNLKKKFNRV